VLDCSESSHSWEVFAGGAKQIAKVIYARVQIYEGDALTMLNWMFYHDALSKISARHWTQKPYKVSYAEEKTINEIKSCARDGQIMKLALLSGNTSKVRTPNSILKKPINILQIINTIGCSADILETIARICDHVLDREDPIRNSVEHIEAVDRFERRLTNVKQYINQEGEMMTSDQEETYKVGELYRLAGLVYLYRACKRLPSIDSKVKTAVETGLSILASLNTCTRSFPLVIIGCEARCDEDRLVVLDLLRRTLGCRETGNIAGARIFVEASWAQDDIHGEEELDYVRKFDAIMGLSKYRPSFAASLMGGWSITA
jgi:hypothetical protein